jgi:hypothetical protein
MEQTGAEPVTNARRFAETDELAADHELRRPAGVAPPNIALQTHLAAARGTSETEERSMWPSDLDTVDQSHGLGAAGPTA